MVAVRVMQMAIDEVVNVIAMRYRFMAATGAMNMTGFMTAAMVFRCAGIGIGRADCNDVLIYVIAMRMVQVTVVQVIDMPFMTKGGMAAVRAMLMIVPGVMRLVASGSDM